MFPTRDGPTEVLRDVTLSSRDGESIAIVGESGSGKSTLVNLIAGYLIPDSGTIACDGRIVTGPGPDRVVVSQANSIYPWLTVAQNARYASMVGHYKKKRAEIEDRADTLLRRFGLWGHRNKYPSALSGGQLRRVELVRAFSVVPRVLLLDEPYTGTDEALRAVLGQHLMEWQRESPDVCTIHVTHDLEDACLLSTRVLILGGDPASFVGAEEVNFGPVRDASLLLRDDFQAVVQRVRRRYMEARSAREDART